MYNELLFIFNIFLCKQLKIKIHKENNTEILKNNKVCNVKKKELIQDMGEIRGLN